MSIIGEFFADIRLGYSILGYNFLSLIIPSALTVIGWIIAAWWAVKQVNLAHEKNRELQHEIMKQSIKDNLYKEFISFYSDIAKSNLNFITDLSMVGINMVMDEHKTDNKLSFGWIGLIDKVTQSYTEFGKNINKLEIWLDATSEFIPNAAEIYAIIGEYKKNFTLSDDNMKNIWTMLQITFVILQKNNKPDVQRYDAAKKPVVQALNDLQSRLKDSAKKVQRCLVMRNGNSIQN